MIAIGEALPPREVRITARHIVLGAMASRDWQPQHHDHGYAIASGHRDIILNTPSQAGWFCGYVTDWTGADARVARWRLRMAHPIVPGDLVRFGGTVRGWRESDGLGWADLDLSAQVADLPCSTMRLLAALPIDRSPWDIDEAIWTPPPFEQETPVEQIK